MYKIKPFPFIEYSNEFEETLKMLTDEMNKLCSLPDPPPEAAIVQKPMTYAEAHLRILNDPFCNLLK